MKLITIFELATKSESELRVLYRAVFNVAARTGKPGASECPWPRWKISTA
ncbi:hypothetical protein KVG95_21690 [Pseudomonas sp. SWRI79]|uniref:Uncharacterized protein n=1 Tax=Pseudomonas farris TaxID=2841207 RepID=A0ABS6PZY7_9PSED|nr:hypothetical protein [Pseudomonas farris]MBV4465944.1 hypothetical protein [Pseudomonas farris]